jgi:hypothetical protein
VIFYIIILVRRVLLCGDKIKPCLYNLHRVKGREKRRNNNVPRARAVFLERI